LFDEDGPAVVSLISACKSLGAMPRPGGVLQQDSFFVHMLRIYDEAMEERRARDQERSTNMAKAKRKQ